MAGACLEPLLFCTPSSFRFFSDLVVTCAMKFLSNLFNRGLPKGKAKDPKDTADTILSHPPTSSSPSQREWPHPIKQHRFSIGTPTSIASFEPLSESKPSSPSLPPIGEIANYIMTSTSHPRDPLSDVTVEESTDITVAFDIKSPRVDQVLAERSSCRTGTRSISTSNGSNGMLKKVASMFLSPKPTIPTDKATTICPPSLQLGKPGTFVPPTCWSESVEETLVTHIGPKERNRQEVMREIVSSEKR